MTGPKGIDWDAQPLGKVPDRELARRLGVDRSTVGQARRRRKIDEWRPVWTPPDPKVADYAQPAKAASVRAVLELGSIEAAAEALGKTTERVRDDLTAAERQAARVGYAPAHDMVHPAPAGFSVKGVSTLYGNDGTVRGQWVKTAADRESQLAALFDAVQSIVEPFRGRSDETKAPKHGDESLLAVYPMGDPHFGLFAWADECGEQFDLATAEANLVAAVDKLVGLAPAAKQALVINLGDFFHADNSSNRTSRSGHALDVDGRWQQILAVGIRAMRRCIDRALEKHESVRVINAIGNHDDHSAIVLSLCLAGYYENNPRVTIDTSPSPFHWLRFGACLLGVTHGDSAKFADLPGIMAHDRAEDWGQTKHRFWYCGHVHHDSLKEFPGVTVETFRTLAARDAWHHRSGYRSGRDMKLDILHRDHGRIARHIVGIDRIYRG